MSVRARLAFVRKAITPARRLPQTWMLPAIAVGSFCCFILQGQSPSPAPGAPPKNDRISIVPRPRPTEPSPADIRVDVNLVEIPVSVTDPNGTPVRGLAADTFRIFEDGVEQPIATVSNQDAPMSIGILFDASNSMLTKVDRSREGVKQLLKTAVNGDEYFLVEFNDSAKVLAGLTSNQGEIESELNYIQPQGQTSLFDAIHLALNHMKKAVNKRHALVLLSDGADNNSRYTEHEIKAMLKESDVSLFAIAMMGPMVSSASIRSMAKLAESTGGKLYRIHDVEDLPEAMEKLSAALRDQYILAYAPTNVARDGKFHKLQVKLTQPDGGPHLRASWRNGYYEQ